MKRLAIGLATVALLAGCASPGTDGRPPLAQRVADLGKEGQAAYFKGDLSRARRLFELALRDARQIEDSESVAAMSINLARVLRESGEPGGPASALAQLEQLPEWQRGVITPRLAAEVELLTAVLLADGGRADESLVRLAVLRGKCAADCGLSAGIESLHARLVLERGDARRALDLADAALARFQADGNRLELANLLRVKGEASLALGDPATARQALEAALATDKALAQPAKIALDLQALADTALAAGDMGAHAHYLARLADVRRARAGAPPR